MAILSQPEIIEYLNSEKIIFDPPIDQFQLQPHAVDLRIGYNFRIPLQWHRTDEGRQAMNIDYLDVNDTKAFEELILEPGQYFEMLPQETIVAQTMEHITINNGNVMAILYPRSSLNRRGLALDLTGIVDCYYSGRLIVPIKNNTNQIIRLYPGERFCSLVFETLLLPLDQSASLKHGVNKAKYSDNGKSDFKKDKNESDYLREGRLDDLKTEYKLG